jgi:hypothetical protein
MAIELRCFPVIEGQRVSSRISEKLAKPRDLFQVGIGLRDIPGTAQDADVRAILMRFLYLFDRARIRFSGR